MGPAPHTLTGFIVFVTLTVLAVAAYVWWNWK
jgi:hypothetical protein